MVVISYIVIVFLGFLVGNRIKRSMPYLDKVLGVVTWMLLFVVSIQVGVHSSGLNNALWLIAFGVVLGLANIISAVVITHLVFGRGRKLWLKR